MKQQKTIVLKEKSKKEMSKIVQKTDFSQKEVILIAIKRLINANVND